MSYPTPLQLSTAEAGFNDSMAPSIKAYIAVFDLLTDKNRDNNWINNEPPYKRERQLDNFTCKKYNVVYN